MKKKYIIFVTNADYHIAEITEEFRKTNSFFETCFSVQKLNEGINENEFNFFIDGEKKITWIAKQTDLQKAKAKKLQEHNDFLDTIVMKINGIPVWFKDELIVSLKKTADNLTVLGKKEFPLMLMENMLFMPDGEAKTRLLNTLFKIDLQEFQKHLVVMDIYAQTILLIEVQHNNKINSLIKIEDVEAYNFTMGYPETIDLAVNFLS